MGDRFEDEFYQEEAEERENPHWRVKLTAENRSMRLGRQRESREGVKMSICAQQR